MEDLDYSWPKFLSIFSLFVNNYTIRFFYNFIFFLKKFSQEKKKILSFEKAIYHSSKINLLPYFFQKGMLEIQISLDKKKFLFFYTYIKEYFLKNDIYPIFFILKKMHPNKKIIFQIFQKITYLSLLVLEKKII